MPTIAVNNGKIKNPIVTKMILKGKENKEIVFENPLILTAKQSFCVVHIAEHYLSNRSNYGRPEDFIEFISKNFQEVLLDTTKGIELGSEINTRLLNKIKKFIDANILVELYQGGKLKIN
ncbi:MULTISPECIES: hypothetical protein [Acinetobacter calcoaceticus/baumannii complex]|uniref:hypothetical protein n=1 Tax=Acinetobacter calcoaceticus/baumannii complex TaxID=909768 RepID=UPI00124F3D8D|nr:hypothetical protein [Acinetobacter nosocomialis]